MNDISKEENEEIILSINLYLRVFSPIEKKEQLEDSRPVSENVTPFHGRTFTGEDFGNVSSVLLFTYLYFDHKMFPGERSNPISIKISK